MAPLQSAGKSPMHCRDAGFTLVELLVVISIVVLLIAILLPALAKAREAGQTVRCLSNMRQLTMVGILYWQDNNDFCVPIVKDPANPNAYTGVVIPGARWAEWADRTYAYLGSVDAMNCPTQNAISGSTSVNMLMSCYVYSWSATYGASVSNGSLLKSIVFRKPSDKIYFADSGYYPGYNGTEAREKFSPFMGYSGENIGTSYTNANRTSPSTRHNSSRSRVDLPGQGPSSPAGYNAGFFDGHAKYMDWKTTFPMRALASASAEDKARRDTYWLP